MGVESCIQLAKFLGVTGIIAAIALSLWENRARRR